MIMKIELHKSAQTHLDFNTVYSRPQFNDVGTQLIEHRCKQQAAHKVGAYWALLILKMCTAIRHRARGNYSSHSGHCQTNIRIFACSPDKDGAIMCI